MKVLFTISGYDEGYLQLADAIFYKDGWWLVSKWLEDPVSKQRYPERIILLGAENTPYTEADGLEYRFVVSSAIPKSVLDGEPQNGYVIDVHPDSIVKTQAPKSIH